MIMAASDTVPVEVLWAGAIAVVLSALVTFAGVLWQTRKTLKHQRALNERSELRKVIDEAAAHLDSVVFDVMTAIANIREVTEAASVGFTKRPSELGDDENKAVGETYQRAIESVFAGVRRADGLGSRLMIRLGPNSDAVLQYQEASSCLHAMHRQLVDGTLIAKGAPEKAFSEIGQHRNAFRDCCYDLVGTDLDG
jgi:hypothetical protein